LGMGVLGQLFSFCPQDYPIRACFCGVSGLTGYHDEMGRGDARRAIQSALVPARVQVGART
jgi:hypothetical protein